MKQGLTEIIVVLDKSGSMEILKKDTIGGFNSFLNTQKTEEGEAKITLILFDTSYNIVYQSVNIKNAAELTEKTYIPCGGTSLYDALGVAMKTTRKGISELPEEDKPEKVIFVVITDGEENSSCIRNKEGLRKYTKESIFEKINKYQKDDGYIFIYLGANQDAMQVGNSMGFTSNNTVTYTGNSRGISASMDSVNTYTTSYRNSKLSSKEFAFTADLGVFYEQSLEKLDNLDYVDKVDTTKTN
jgi:uncharacterized protein YegL